MRKKIIFLGLTLSAMMCSTIVSAQISKAISVEDNGGNGTPPPGGGTLIPIKPPKPILPPKG